MTGRTRDRAAWLRGRLGERDVAVLESLHQLRLLRGDQVQRLHVADGSPLTQSRRTRFVLKRLHDLGLVIRLARTIGGVRAGSSGHVYGLSGLGQAVLDVAGPYGRRRRAVWETKPYFQDHVLAVAELAVRLTEVSRTGDGLEVLIFDGEPVCWRSYSGLGGEPCIVKPDAFVRVAIGDIERSSFVEVDLANEGPATIRRKCQAFISYWRSGFEQQRHGVFPVVLWLVPNHHRKVWLLHIVKQLATDTQQLFAVSSFSDGVAWLTAPKGGAA